MFYRFYSLDLEAKLSRIVYICRFAGKDLDLRGVQMSRVVHFKCAPVPVLPVNNKGTLW